MDTHALTHVRELLATLTGEQVEATTIACDERARAMLSLLALIEHPPGGRLTATQLDRLSHHLAQVLQDQPDDEVHIVKEFRGVRSHCSDGACRGQSGRPVFARPGVVTRKLAPATRFTQTVLRVLGDLAWLRLQSLAHATMQPPAEAPAGAAAILDARTKVLYREPPAGVASDLMMAAINLVGAVRVPVAALKLAVQDAVPADAAAEFWGEIEDALGHEMRNFLGWLPETQPDSKEAAHVASVDPR